MLSLFPAACFGMAPLPVPVPSWAWNLGGTMDDAIYLLLGLSFFALMALFARLCARL
jgi:hypothetical protein